MQQLFAAFGVNWQLLLAQVVNFAIVLFALWYFLYKPVLKTLEERRHVVAKGVADAQKAEEKLAHADGEALARVKDAEKEAESIVNTARADAGAKRTEILSAAEIRAQHIEKEAAARAAQEAARSARESEKEIARLAVLAAEKVIAKHD